MLTFPSVVRVFLAVEPIDMRGSFDALAGHARRLRLEPTDGHLYVFLNARKTLMKLIFLDRGGWTLVARRLERGSFQVPDVAATASYATLDSATLGLILEGYDLRRAPRRLRFEPKFTSK